MTDIDTTTIFELPDRKEFDDVMNVICSRTACNGILWPKERYMKVVKELKAAKCKVKKTPVDYRRIKQYDVINTPDGDRLIVKQKPGDKNVQMYVYKEEIYDIIQDAHLKSKHGGRSKIINMLRPLYKNITNVSVRAYLHLCGKCKTRLSSYKKLNEETNYQSSNSYQQNNDNDCSDIPLQEESDYGNNSNKLLEETSTDFQINLVKSEVDEESDNVEESLADIKVNNICYLSLRGQVDVLDLELFGDEEFKFLMVYRNFNTKCIVLKSLKVKSIDEIAHNLLDTFLMHGAPTILQSQNGRNLVIQLVKRIYKIYPMIKIVHGDVIRSDENFVGKSNLEIQNKLAEWCKKNNKCRWHLGLKFIQYEMNTYYHMGLRKSPFEAAFGSNPMAGLASYLPMDIWNEVNTEEDLKDYYSRKILPCKSLITDKVILPNQFSNEDSMDENDD